MKNNNFFDLKLLKFLLVGVVNTLFGAGIMFFLYNIIHCSYWVSSACNYIFGGILSYILNKHFTFKNNERSFLQVFMFALTVLICYLIAYILAKHLVFFILRDYPQNVKDNVAMLAGIGLYTLLNYTSQRFIVFKAGEKK